MLIVAAVAVLRRSNIRNCLVRTFTMTAKKEFERLPTSVKPVNYNIRLHPDLEKFTFTGVEVIDVEVRVEWCPWFNHLLGI